MDLSWDDYLELRQARLECARRGTVRLPGWNCDTTADLGGVKPDAVARAAVLAEAALLPVRTRHAAAPRHDAWLFGRPLTVAQPPTPTTWARARLIALGERLETEGRRSWADDWTPEAALDAQAAEVLAGLAAGSWTVRATAEAVWLAPVVRSFRGVCLARRLPDDVRRRAIDQLREGFFYRLALPDERGVPGWCELAGRTLEAAGPLAGMVTLFDTAQRRRAAWCAVSRGGWADSARALVPSPDRTDRALHILQRLDDLDVLVDAHVQRRLVSRWQAGETDPDADWRVVVQARARARARLRALAAERPDALLTAVLSLPALAARTRDAAARWAWAWAWDELARDFAFSLDRPATAPCDQPDPGDVSWPADWNAPLDTWLLLVALRGRWSHLARWVAEGRTGDRDSTWGRLLADALPEPLAVDRYARLRRELRTSLAARRDRLRPVLQSIAHLPGGRRLKRDMLALLTPAWHPDVPLPKSGFPSFLRAARTRVEAP